MTDADGSELDVQAAAAEQRALGGALLDRWWAVRDVGIEGTRLVPELTAVDGPVRPDGDLLSEFLSIWTDREPDLEPVRALHFARRYGLLGVHRDESRSQGPKPEDLTDWREWIREARAILRVSADLRRGKTPDRSDVDVLEAATVKLDIETLRQLRAHGKHPTWNRRNYRRNVALRLNRWLALGRVTLLVRWPERYERGADGAVDEPVYVAQAAGTFGALALALTAAVTRTDNLKPCRGCGTPFEGRIYCPTCRQAGVAERDASRRYRAKKAERSKPQRPAPVPKTREFS